MVRRATKPNVPSMPTLPQGVDKVINCGNCGKPITGGWSQSPKGRACDPCWRGYMNGGWPICS